MGERSKLEKEFINKGISGETMGTNELTSKEFTKKRKGEIWESREEKGEKQH